MSWIAGIDYSTHAIDVVLIDEDERRLPHWRSFALDGQDAFDRTRSVKSHGHMLTRLMADVVAVGIEDPAGKHGVKAMARVQGALLARLPRNLLVQPLPPAKWRKIVGLPGNASKEAIKSQVITWAWAGGAGEWPQDACDAYCIARATRILIGQGKVAA